MSQHIDRALTVTTKQLKVFLSYARSDGSVLAEELVAGLEVAGVLAYLDRHDIAAGEDWEQRLDGLIRQADTVVFIVTPRSMASERCQWEVDRALALAKRIIPVVGMPVPEDAVPAQLRRLNYIHFSEGRSFAQGLRQLAAALFTDLDWVREHTRLAELARRWEERERVESLLLRDDELSSAQAWQGSWEQGRPSPTDEHRSFITASAEAQDARANQERLRNQTMARANAERAEALMRQEEATRLLKRRTVVAAAGVGALSLGLAGTALWAVREREQALSAHIRREAARRDITGQVVAYAASPGQMATDSGMLGNSPYTATLLEELGNDSNSLWQALSVTSLRVNRESHGLQRPFVSSDMNGDLYLGQPTHTRRQKAIVIAVGSFQHVEQMRFEGVYRDLDAWSIFLRKRSFDVTALRDPTSDQMKTGLDSLRVAEEWSAAPRIIRVGERQPSPPPPVDSLVLVIYSGYGFMSGTQRFIAGTDLQRSAVKEDSERSALSVATVEKQVRETFAASVLVYDTQFL